MPWVKVVTGWGPNGPIYKTVWVAEPPKPKPKKSSAKKKSAGAPKKKKPNYAALRAAAEARRRAAERARQARLEAMRRAAASRISNLSKKNAAQYARVLAARRAKQEAIRRSRTLAQAELKRREEDALEQIQARYPGVKPLVRRRPIPPANQADLAGEKNERLRQLTEFQKRNIAAQQAASEAKRIEAERNRVANEWYQKSKQAILTNRTAVETSTLESMMAQEQRRAKDGLLDTNTVELLTEEYVKRSEKVAASYTSKVAAINKAIDDGDYKKAKRLYNADFLKLSREYQRLFGTSGEVDENAAFSQFFKRRQEIDLATQEYWKRQMKAALQSFDDDINAQIRQAMAANDWQRVSELTATLQEEKTGLVPQVDSQGRVTYRQRTMQEELQYREARRRMEMERLRNEYEYNEAEARRQAMMNGQTKQDQFGNWVTPEHKQAEDDALRIIKTKFNGEAPLLTRPQDLSSFADSVVSDWVDRHPKPLHTLYGYGSPLFRQKLDEWNRQKEEYERSVFNYLGSGVPQWWDRALQAPGVSHAVAMLQAGVSSIGAAERVLVKIGTGTSQIIEIGLSDLPEEVKDKMGVGGPVAGFVDVASKLPGGYLTQQFLLNQWLATPEGKQWLEEYKEKAAAEAQLADEKFAGTFYSDKEDLAAKLDALNEYGSYPTTSDASNLMFQLLADPTNAIPLKFTTYLARAKYAAELSGQSKFLGTNTLGRVRDFVKVSEAELRMRGFLQKRVKNLDESQAQALIDNLRAEIAGTAQKSDLTRKIEKVFRQAGIDPALMNDTQIAAQLEQMIIETAQLRGRKIFMPEDELAEKIKLMEAEDLAAKNQRAAERQAAEQAQKQREQARVIELEEAVNRLRIERQADIARTAHAARAADTTPSGGVVAPPAKAAEEVAGPLPPAKTSKYASPEEARLARNKRRREARAQKRDAEAKALAAKAAHADRALRRSITEPRVVGGEPVIPERPQPRVVVDRKRALPDTLKVQDPAEQIRNAPDASRGIQYAHEYYKVEGGVWLPKDSRLVQTPVYRKLREAADAGNKAAEREIRRLARRERNQFRLEREDFAVRSQFTATDADLAERAGVDLSDESVTALKQDREMIRWLKRRVAKGLQDSYVGSHVWKDGRIVRDRTLDKNEYVDDLDAFDDMVERSQGINIGEDMIAARKLSPYGIHNLYEVFSGLPSRVESYSGGYFDRVRDANWRNGLTRNRFMAILAQMDEGFPSFTGKKFRRDDKLAYEGAAGFRDGGQALFELFHRLRVDGNYEQLRKMSKWVNDYIDTLDEAEDSVFAWQWKVMEERANLPWAMDNDIIEVYFMNAAERYGLHPNHAMAMIPNGFYAHVVPNRFSLSSPLKQFEDSPLYKAHPENWVETNALDAISRIFSKKSPEATQVLHYIAHRFGNLELAFKPKGRMQDGLIASVMDVMGAEELSKVLMDVDGYAFIDLFNMYSRRFHGSKMPHDRKVAVIRKAIEDHVAQNLKTGRAPKLRNGKVGRPEWSERAFPGMRRAMESAYNDVAITLDNPEAHKLILLTRIQWNPGGIFPYMEIYINHMEAIGKIDEGIAFIKELRRDSLLNLNMRYVNERLDGVTGTGTAAITREWALYDRLGLTPSAEDIKRFKAYRDNVQRGVTSQRERVEEARLEQLGQFDTELEMARDLWHRRDADSAADAIAGHGALDRVVAGFEHKMRTYNKFRGELEKMKEELDEVLKQEAAGIRVVHSNLLESEIRILRGKVSRALNSIVSDLEATLYANVDTGGKTMTGDTFEQIEEIIGVLRQYPYAAKLLDKVADRIGDTMLYETRHLMAEPVAYQEALFDLQLRLLPEEAVEEARKLRLLKDKARPKPIVVPEAAAAKLSDAQKQALADSILAKKEELGEVKKRVPRKHRKKMEEAKADYDAQPVDPAATAENPVLAPTPDPTIAAAPRDAAADAVRLLTGLTEAQWWRKAYGEAYNMLRNPRATPAQKARAKQIMADVRAAEQLRLIERQRGTLSLPAERRASGKRVVKSYGKDAEDYVAPNKVAPYAEDEAALVVEEGRTYHKQWKRALRGPIGESNVTGIQLADGSVVDYMPREVFAELEPRVADAIAEARKHRANNRIRGRGPAAELRPDSEDASRMSDNDPLIVNAKLKAIAQFARDTGIKVSVEAYDEARTVLWTGYVQNKTASWILETARAQAKKYGSLKAALLAVRKSVAANEARKQLWRLGVEMLGSTPEAIFAEFVARYGDDGFLRHEAPKRSLYQIKTLEQNFISVAGLKAYDPEDAAVFLGSRNMPSMTNRELQRDFLTGIGAWSTRKAEQFTLGARSWNIDEEYQFMMDSYGQAPEWALRDTYAKMPDFFDDHGVRMEQNREWGFFNRSVEAKLRLSEKDADEIADAYIKGDPELGVKARRSLHEMRQFYIDRYGDLVANPDGSFHTVPELMYPEELKQWWAKRTLTEAPIAEGLFHTPEELLAFRQVAAPLIDRYFDDFMAAQSGVVRYEDMFRFMAELQARLAANPKWAKRHRDLLGRVIGGYGTIQRAMVFTQMSFAAMNAIDSPIKNLWYRYTSGGVIGGSIPPLSEAMRARVAALTPTSLGIKYKTTLMNYNGRPGIQKAMHPLNEEGLARAMERAGGIAKAWYEFYPGLAARAEIASKMNLARDIYPRVYPEMLKAAKGNEELADLLAKRFIKDEVSRMWPTRGDGPIERLFNNFVPFASYMFKNHVLFIGEAAAHPSVINWFEYVGSYIEDQNREAWAAKYGEEPMPPQMARRLELPWAPGYYLDLGQFTDATRGLKPLYKAEAPQTPLDFGSQWLRLVNPNTQAFMYQMMNAFGAAQRIQWKPVYNERGFLIGYEKVMTGWTEPWSREQPTLSSWFWPADLFESFYKFGAGNWTAGELSQFFGKAALFEAIAPADRGYGLYQMYRAMLAKNRDAATKWLNSTEEGALVREWMAGRASNTYDVQNILMLNERLMKDPNFWLHTRSPEFQRAIREGYQTINGIRDYWEDKLLRLTPGTVEYQNAKASMLLHIMEVYGSVPELMRYEVWSKSPDEWSETLADWETDKLTDDYFALAADRPQRADFDSVVEYNKAIADWKHAKNVYLKQYPDVAARIAGARGELQRVRDLVNEEWDRVFTRIAKRNEAIEAAEKIDDKERASYLHFANSLEYTLLERDYVAMHFTEEDLVELERGQQGPRGLKAGAMKAATVLLDFDAVRREKAKREGKLQEFLDETFYRNGMSEISLIAKGGDPFGKFNPAKWVRELKKRPRLLSMYYANNPGKKQEWEKNEEYIKYISKWGKAIAAGASFDTSLDIWKSLPVWVRQRYLDTHEDSKMTLSGEFASSSGGGFKAGSAQGAAYFGYMQKWTKFFENNDVKGGMEYFWKMPSWVRERYFEKNPDKRVKWEAELKYGSDLATYFSFQNKSEQAEWLKNHPELQKWLAKNVSNEEARRQAILVAYSKLPKGDAWIRKVFRERFPEVFSVEAAGERKLRRVYDQLAEHPDMLPDFEAWVKAIWDSYAMMQRYGKPRPKPLELEREKKKRRHKWSQSAEEVSKT